MWNPFVWNQHVYRFPPFVWTIIRSNAWELQKNQILQLLSAPCVVIWCWWNDCGRHLILTRPRWHAVRSPFAAVFSSFFCSRLSMFRKSVRLVYTMSSGFFMSATAWLWRYQLLLKAFVSVNVLRHKHLLATWVLNPHLKNAWNCCMPQVKYDFD